ncbi:MAG: GNAT family N-acetyltransferase [Lachnospiraceae bacterium]
MMQENKERKQRNTLSEQNENRIFSENEMVMPEEEFLRGNKVSLRKITVEDTDNIIRWRNSEPVMKNFIYRTPLTREVHLNWFHTKVATGRVMQYIIVVNETGEEIGSVYLQNFDEEKKETEFGIFIGEESAYGKGYGSEAEYLLVHYALTCLGMEQVVTRVLFTNPRSITVQEKTGFHYQYDEWKEIEGKKERICFFVCKKKDLPTREVK